MKLLIIGHHIVVKEYQELWVAAAKQFPEISFEILCPQIYEQAGPVAAEALDPDTVPVHTLRAPFGPAGRQHLHFYLGLGRMLDQIQPDYVYALEESNSIVTAQIAHACVKRDIPYCFWTSLNTLRIYRKMYPLWNIRRYLYTWCQRYTFRTSAGANATSPEAVDVLRKQGYRGPITCRGIHGIGHIFTDIGERRVQDTTTPAVPLRIGFIGRLWHWKAVDVLIRAYAMMKNRQQVSLSIRGSGECSDSLPALARELGVHDEIIWHPDMVDYADMPAEMEKLDLLVLPSCTRGGINEKFGRVLIEAMAAGVVAVGCDDGGIPKALAGGGLLFPPEDHQALADILDQLSEDRQWWKARQRKGFEAVQQHFSYAVIARKQIEGLMEDIGYFKGGKGVVKE